MFGKALFILVVAIIAIAVFLVWLDGWRAKRRKRQQQKIFLDVKIEGVPYWAYKHAIGPFDTIAQLQDWERRFKEGLKNLSLPSEPSFTHRYSDSYRWTPEDALSDLRKSLRTFASLPVADLPTDRYVN
ncbi:MAG: hypothetical protein QY323_00255 [Patescibacteria group bacterium]|nr:MAG: hypothetical protein QY323_00255 [Patescibacteria group bacterium]